jgi:hypothetical protein
MKITRRQALEYRNQIRCQVGASRRAVIIVHGESSPSKPSMLQGGCRTLLGRPVVFVSREWMSKKGIPLEVLGTR